MSRKWSAAQRTFVALVVALIVLGGAAVAIYVRDAKEYSHGSYSYERTRDVPADSVVDRLDTALSSTTGAHAVRDGSGIKITGPCSAFTLTSVSQFGQVLDKEGIAFIRCAGSPVRIGPPWR